MTRRYRPLGAGRIIDYSALHGVKPQAAPRQWTQEEIEASRSRYYQPGERDPIMGVRSRDWDYPEPKGA